MRAAAEIEGAADAERLGTAVGKVASELRPEAVAGESGAPVPDVAGRWLPEQKRECAGLWESGVGEESSSDGAGAGTGGGWGAQDAFHQVRSADAGSAGGQAGPEAERGDQTAGPV